MALHDHAGSNLLAVHPLATNVIPVAGLLGETADLREHDVRGQTRPGLTGIDRLTHNQAERNSGDFGADRILDYPQSGNGIVDGFDASDQLIGAVEVRTIKLVITRPVFVIKKHVERLGENRIIVRVKPDFESPQVSGVAVNILLLRRPEGNVGAPAIGTPTIGTRAGAKARVGEGDPFVNLLFIRVWL